MFRILVVEDSPAAARLLQDVMDQLELKHELHFVTDGVEALDFLHCRGAHASRPNLILLDMNMPRLGGLETLSAIKNDSELCVIPVIMLSARHLPAGCTELLPPHTPIVLCSSRRTWTAP
jgi:CheY-like chemotaxis protein